MAAHPNPTVGRRRLGAELRKLRESKGMTARHAAESLMISQPKLSLLENGHRAVKPRDVRDLCALYGVEDQQFVDSLIHMARESGQQGWWNTFGDVPYGAYIGLEAAATSLRSYDPLVIPGLLQTPAYARAVIAGTIPRATAEQIDTHLRVRLRRQDRLTGPSRPLRLRVVLDESALWRAVGGTDVMRAQLEHLAVMSARPHVTLRVLPHGAGAHPGVSGQFSLLEFAGGTDPGVVYLERFTGDVYLEKPSEVAEYDTAYGLIRDRAAEPDATGRFLTEAAERYAGADCRPNGPGPSSGRRTRRAAHDGQGDDERCGRSTAARRAG